LVSIRGTVQMHDANAHHLAGCHIDCRKNRGLDEELPVFYWIKRWSLFQSFVGWLPFSIC
jgi:hypothetical protein